MIVQQCKQLLQQLIDVTAKLSNEAYAQKIPLLGSASVGSHTRHIIEFVQEMLKGYRLECINYDVRKRDITLEADVEAMHIVIQQIIDTLPVADKKIQLRTNYNINDNEAVVTVTSYQRELIYNIEHIIHHMALMRVALEHYFKIEVPADFGIAPSTLRYQYECVQ